MMRRGFAFVTNDNRYLYFEQESERDVHAYRVDSPIDAHLFDTKEEALQVVYNMNTEGALDWDYRCTEEMIPYKIVEVTVLCNVEIVQSLIKN